MLNAPIRHPKRFVIVRPGTVPTLYLARKGWTELRSEARVYARAYAADIESMWHPGSVVVPLEDTHV